MGVYLYEQTKINENNIHYSTFDIFDDCGI